MRNHPAAAASGHSKHNYKNETIMIKKSSLLAAYTFPFIWPRSRFSLKLRDTNSPKLYTGPSNFTFNYVRLIYFQHALIKMKICMADSSHPGNGA